MNKVKHLLRKKKWFQRHHRTFCGIICDGRELDANDIYFDPWVKTPSKCTCDNCLIQYESKNYEQDGLNL